MAPKIIPTVQKTNPNKKHPKDVAQNKLCPN